MQSRVSSVRFGRAAGRAKTGSPPLANRHDSIDRAIELWGRVSWPVSISLFAVPVALALLTFTVPRLWASPEIAIRVTDRYTGQHISGATLVIGESTMRTDPDGTAAVELRTDSSPATIQAPGYEAITTTLSRRGPKDWQVALRPTVLRGRLADAETSAGIAGAEVAVIAPDGTEQKTTTDADGRYLVRRRTGERNGSILVARLRQCQ